jgi:replication factor A1
MSGVEDTIKKILAMRPELTKEAVRMMIEEEKAKAGGLLTEEAAAHIVASILGLGPGQRAEAKTKIGKLTSGLGDVSLTGRIIHVFPPRKFTRRDGRSGKVVGILLGDETGSVRVVLWDEKADLISAGRIQPGKVVRILHGYTRERQGEVEVNVGRRGEIYLEPMDVKPEELPGVEAFFLEPGEVHEAGRVNLMGVVFEKSSVSAFSRRDGGEGRVMRMRLSNLKGGEVFLVLWDDSVDTIGAVDVGTRLRIVDGRARERMDGRMEVHVSRSTSVEVVEKGVDITSGLRGAMLKVGEIKPGMRNISLQGRVTGTSEARAFKRRDGEEGKVASLLLQDETGSIRLSLWDEDVKSLETIKEGDIVSVEGAYARESLGGLGLNLGSGGRITTIQKAGELSPRTGAAVVKLGDLREGMGDITVEGSVVEAPSIREVTTQRGEAVRVASFIIDDGTGDARVSLWRGLVKEVENLSIGATVRIENCYVRSSYNDRMDVTSGTFTKIKIG